MTPEKQRISIAEACGWKRSKDGDWIDHNDKTCVYGLVDDLPDYINDLNAMHEAEKTLENFDENGGPDQSLYCETLARVVHARWDSNNIYDEWCLAHATAAQRAEAFLKTLNLWTQE